MSGEAVSEGRAEGIVVRIDREVCMGSGNCMFWAPESFDLADDGRAVVLEVSATDLERLRVAVDGCPVGAISLTTDDGEGG